MRLGLRAGTEVYTNAGGRKTYAKTRLSENIGICAVVGNFFSKPSADHFLHTSFTTPLVGLGVDFGEKVDFCENHETKKCVSA